MSNGSLNSLVLSSDGSNAAVLGSGEAISTDQDGATPSPISGSKLMNALAKTFSGKKQMQSGESSTVKANDGASTVVGLANNGGLNSSKVVSNAGFDSSNTFDVVVQVGDSKGQHALRNLMQWYAVLDPEVGYCQGMGFIAALLLTYLIEEHAFYCFYSLMTVSICFNFFCQKTKSISNLSFFVSAPNCPTKTVVFATFSGGSEDSLRFW